MTQNIKNYLVRKNVEFSLERYGIKALAAMTKGLFASLIIGLILQVLGEQLSIPLLVNFSEIAMDMMGPAIGVSVAYGLQAPPLVIFTSVITGAAGAELGGPVGAFLAAIIGAECGKLISKETKLDIVLTPMTVIISGLLVADFVGPAIDTLMTGLGQLIIQTTELHPIPMGILVSVLMGMALTLPISSAAIGLMLSLSGLAAGAATVGCSAQMIGFAVISFRENGWGGLVSQGLGTSMLQIPNIVKNPYIWIPPTLTGAILGPIATTLIPLKNIPIGSGMGTAGLVGQFGTIEAMGTEVIGAVILLHFVLPASLSFLIYKIMYSFNLIQDKDLLLDI
ncbi:PTS sugar transporter subunit IIC [Natroniella acetigena]|uniref:PTS transporter subunit IIC n=1 Tax=Natroniella acetigena TaxID=52004 RepID=UPI002009FC13|nr:PTS sugar transporter subunit IIC [Natroniella acetigena]MCK8827189.1 PTS sugar transporter subunit IIC [Natroniella acetigena]